MSEKMIKGYKGFDKGLVCRNKQYAENTTFKEDSATLCENGMHFCEHPFDVLNYYPCYNNKKKEFSEYAEVLASEEATAKGENKTVTKELKIGARISFDKLIKFGVDFNLSKVKYNKDNKATGNYSGASTTGNYSGASATGNYSGASATGYSSGASTTGYGSGASATGNYSGASTTGYGSGASTTGDCSGASTTGNYSGASTTGYSSGASTTGNYSGASATGSYSGASTTGYSSGASATGDCSGASTTGNYSGASATGDCSGASTTGNYSGASATGYGSGASATGYSSGAMAVGTKVQAKCTNNSVAMAVGEGSMAKGGIGCYIVMTECLWDEEKEIYKIIDCKCFKVDGEIIKADTFYKLVNGEPVEVE